MHSFGALHRLNIKISDVALAVAQRDADLVLDIHHHVVLHESARAVIDAHDALLHGHLVWARTPAGRVVLPLLATRRRCDGYTSFGEGEAASSLALPLCDSVATRGVPCSRDTPRMC